jgi:hypothetical protein
MITPAIANVGGTFVARPIPEGFWNGLTGFVVTVVDRRSSTVATKRQSIGKVISKSNAFGYKTAHDALAESFRQTTSEMLLFIDASTAR